MLVAVSLFAGEPAPTPYNSYEGYMPGAKAGAMGGAFTAVADDASCVYYNPAGLAILKSGYLSMTLESARQSELTPDEVFAQEVLKNRSVQHICFASEKGAVSWRPLANTVIRETSGSDWQETEIKVNAYTLSGSHKNMDRAFSGINITYFSAQMAISGVNNNVPSLNLSDGYGFSADVGYLFMPSPFVNIGIVFKNLLGYVWWDDFEKDQLPFVMRGGLAFKIGGFMVFATDWEKRYYRKVDAVTITHFGLEQKFAGAMVLRAGMYGDDLNDKEKAKITYGLGYSRAGYEFALCAEKYRVDFNDVVKYIFSLNLPI
ncbi:MAG: hypothetical protein JW803_06600 [Endomicrobiales bacterium]|nr:hypothetical protein [Endomicrobiales bacterium]